MNVAVAAYTLGISIVLILLGCLIWGLYQGRPDNRWWSED